MASLTGLSTMPASAKGLLQPDETALAYEIVQLAWGENRIGRAGEVTGVTGVDLNPINLATGVGGVQWDAGFAQRKLGGISLTGSTSSVAASLGAQLHSASSTRLAVTTARLVLFRRLSSGMELDPELGRKVPQESVEAVWSVGRSAVRSAQRRARPFMAGRAVIEFADGSTVALMCGMVSPRAANRLCAALMGS
jgi:hypothetical protein